MAASLDMSITMFRRITALLLCFFLLGEPGFTAAWTHRRVVPSREIQGRQRVLHALNRLTFGPRPGDVETVERMGLDAWFERQLAPGTIDDHILESRLAAFPAMNLSQTALLDRYPSPQRLRQMTSTGAPLPSDPVEHAIYADQLAFYATAQAGREKEQAAKATALAKELRASRASGTQEMGQGVGVSTEARFAAKGRRRGIDLVGGESSGYILNRGRAAKPHTAEPDQGSMTAPPQLQGAVPGKEQDMHHELLFPEAKTTTILALPPTSRLQYLLAMPPGTLVSFRRSLSPGEVRAITAGFNPEQMEIVASLEGSERMINAELLQSRLERDIYSERQIEAVMTDFWLNHFNVYLRKNQNEPFLLPSYEREVIRPHSLGHFEDLLVATAQSSAMLMYLDNWESVGPDSLAVRRGGSASRVAMKEAAKAKDRGLNENYARELMELHTLGVGCEVSADHSVFRLDAACGTGYTQADVTAVAKVFSGWTIERPNQGAVYRFDERRHEPGEKVILGETIPEGGEFEGREVLHLLATSPATARLIATELAIRFVSDTPSANLVDRMSKTFVSSQGDMRAVLRTMFAAPEFWAPSVVQGKVKTPLEFLTSAVRASNAKTTNAVSLVTALDRLGMPLYGMQTPNGYSWLAEVWVNTGALVSRMNFALALTGNRVSGTTVNLSGHGVVKQGTSFPVSMSNAVSSGNGEVEERALEMMLLGRPASDRTRAAVMASASPETGGSSPAVVSKEQMAGLLLGSPDFQLR